MNSSICACISAIFSRMFRMISTPARFTPRSRVRCRITSSRSKSSSVYRRVFPSLRDGLSKPSRSYSRSVCGWISYCSATEEIMYAALDFTRAISHLCPDFLARIFRIELRQFAQNFLSAFVVHLRRLNHDLHNLIAALVTPRVEYAAFPQPELLPVLRPLRHLQQRAPVDGGHFDLGAQSGFGDRDRHPDQDIVALAVEKGMFFSGGGDVQTAGRPSHGPCVALAGPAQPRPVAHSGRDPHFH